MGTRDIGFSSSFDTDWSEERYSTNTEDAGIRTLLEPELAVSVLSMLLLVGLSAQAQGVGDTSDVCIVRQSALERYAVVVGTQSVVHPGISGSIGTIQGSQFAMTRGSGGKAIGTIESGRVVLKAGLRTLRSTPVEGGRVAVGRKNTFDYTSTCSQSQAALGIAHLWSRIRESKFFFMGFWRNTVPDFFKGLMGKDKPKGN